MRVEIHADIRGETVEVVLRCAIGGATFRVWLSWLLSGPKKLLAGGLSGVLRPEDLVLLIYVESLCLDLIGLVVIHHRCLRSERSSSNHPSLYSCAYLGSIGSNLLFVLANSYQLLLQINSNEKLSLYNNG